MLKQRLITAAILIPIFVFLILALPPLGFAILTLVLVLYGAWEWSALMGIQKPILKLFYPFLLFPFLAYSILIPIPYLLIGAFVWWLIAFVLVVKFPRASQWWGQGYVIRALMGVMVLMPAWRALNFIRANTHGTYILLLLFVLIWGADSGAYFAGKKWGKTKLAPAVSPGKTWQGLMGALATTLCIACAAAAFQHLSTPVTAVFIVLALVTVIFSILGDLFESMLKRQVNIKDSGSLIPGHGGLLDRIDSLTAAAPIFALGAICITKLFS